MAVIKSIQELFQPLAARLTIIESQMAEPYKDPSGLLKDIGQNIMVIPENEIIPAIEKYIKWINNLASIGSYNDRIKELPGYSEIPWAEPGNEKDNEEITKEL